MSEWVDGLDGPWRHIVRPFQLVLYLAVAGVLGLGGILAIAGALWLISSIL